MLQKSERPEVTDPKQFAKDFKKYEEAVIEASPKNENKRRSIKDFILDTLDSFFEPVIERALVRIRDRKTAAYEKLRQDLAEAYAKAPNPLKEYEQSRNMKVLGKTINDIALWRAGKEQAKKGKNPKAKPIKRREGLELDRYKSVRPQTNKELGLDKHAGSPVYKDKF